LLLSREIQQGEIIVSRLYCLEDDSLVDFDWFVVDNKERFEKQQQFALEQLILS